MCLRARIEFWRATKAKHWPPIRRSTGWNWAPNPSTATTGLENEPEALPFSAAIGKTGKLSRRPLVRTDAADLLKRRLKQAGLPAHYSPHSFLATGIAKFLESDGTLRPLIRVFHVNSLRKDEKGKFLWPGYGENMRILKWIVDRARGRARAKETFIGWMPHYEDLDRTGLDFPKEDFEQLQKVDRHARRSEIIGHEELFLDLHEGLPKEMLYERELLICRI